MKTCVYIIGTNASGKSTLARNLLNKFGGAVTITRTLTTATDKRVCFAGKYAEDSKYGGVDGLNGTSELAAIVENALQQSEVIICEGSFMNNFGNSLTNAIFKAQAQFIVFLFASSSVLKDRLAQRSKTDLKDTILKKQQSALNACKKWKAIGVQVVPINTDNYTPQEIAEQVYDKILIAMNK